MGTEQALVARIRADYPLLGHVRWLASAATGPMSSGALEAMEQTQGGMYRRFHREAWERDYPAEARSAIGRLLGADEGEIALVRSTSEGLIAVGTSIPWRRGDRVVITDQEYPANAVPWFHLAHRNGLQVRVVRSVGGRLPVSEFARQVDRRTKVIAVSHVQFASGFRADLAGLAELAQSHGALLVVDGIQSVGALQVPVRELGVDAVACGGYKWLCGPVGTGFLYVSRQAAEHLLPQGAGYEHLACGERDELLEALCGGGTWVRETAELAEDARRFDGIGHNCALLAGLTSAVCHQLELGPQWIERRVLELSGRLGEMARGAGYDVLTPEEDEERAGIVHLRGPWDMSQPDARTALEGALCEQEIVVSLRAGGVRVACHFFNDEDDLQRLLEALGSLPRTGNVRRDV